MPLVVLTGTGVGVAYGIVYRIPYGKHNFIRMERTIHKNMYFIFSNVFHVKRLKAKMC